MLGADRDPVVIDEMLVPPESHGVRCISIGYFVPEGQAVIWRGPMLHKALEQFLTDVFWDEPDFLLIDMPPGTGDIALSLSQYLPRGEVYVVTTPQPAAQKVARAVGGDGRQGQPDRSRASSRTCAGSPATTASATRSSARAAARSWPTSSACRCSASCRWCRRCARAATTAIPITAADPDSEAAKLFHEIARRIAVELKPKKVFSAALKIG